LREIDFEMNRLKIAAVLGKNEKDFVAGTKVLEKNDLLRPRSRETGAARQNSREQIISKIRGICRSKALYRILQALFRTRLYHPLEVMAVCSVVR
jgi:hypothetical protein